MSRLSLAVLDTSLVISPTPTVGALADTFCISAMTLAELQFGVANASDPSALAKRQLRYLETMRDYAPVPYTELVAHWHGTFMAMDQRAGRNPRARAIDLAIAATAKALGGGVITRNPRDFRSVEDVVPILAVDE